MKTVEVTHKTKTNAQGKAYLTKGRKEIRKVAIEYGDGQIKDHVGDVWKVKPHSKSYVTYLAIA